MFPVELDDFRSPEKRGGNPEVPNGSRVYAVIIKLTEERL